MIGWRGTSPVLQHASHKTDGGGLTRARVRACGSRKMTFTKSTGDFRPSVVKKLPGSRRLRPLVNRIEFILACLVPRKAIGEDAL